MIPKIYSPQEILPDQNILALLSTPKQAEKLKLSTTEKAYVESQLKDEKEFIHINSYFKSTFIVCIPQKKLSRDAFLEKVRKGSISCLPLLQEKKATELVLQNLSGDAGQLTAALEGLVLASYRFDKYLTEKKKDKPALERLGIPKGDLSAQELRWYISMLKGTYIARDLMNEPLSGLTAVQMAKIFTKHAAGLDLQVEVMNKQKIAALKMGGILAVNKGSIDPPTFSILEYKPEGAVNSKPWLLVGKGIVYDTGGLSLKPTKDSMDQMKVDMGGAAAVFGSMYAVASARLPVHVVGLIPATDNRPGGNAYVPGDIITMYNGKTVEVLNTDAEGRLILADALSYVRRYDPEWTLSIATLTGSAEMAIGHYGMVGMGNAPKSLMQKLQKAGDEVYERVVEFPFWDEYGDEMKSHIADYKNIGQRGGGAISAGKFLEFFTDYPYLHLDMAGVAFLAADDGYRLKGGSGMGVRLLASFIRRLSEDK